MRVLNALILFVTASLIVILLTKYVASVRELIGAGLQTGGRTLAGTCYELRNDIVVAIWKPHPGYETTVKAGWSVFWYGDAPEGSRAFVYFPTWYLFIPLGMTASLCALAMRRAE